ncbi:ABC transporter substrate-binding protein [Numidum massiliense]|uniref:ABC transporter substrate-binding protein n=1 Tax=Numidum massiliense TaxID=1522315 RepID=UPI0006D52E33|nr:ABC transporter substrate-binding protein [Numidum massiliense]
MRVDDELKYQPHIAEWETKDNKVYTFKFKKGVKWHNGEELTVEDWKYALEVIAHKDYDGSRFKNVEKIEGVPSYHKGKAKVINTPIPSNHWVSADEKELTQYTYDPEEHCFLESRTLGERKIGTIVGRCVK